jgi:hypothetical protein
MFLYNPIINPYYHVLLVIIASVIRVAIVAGLSVIEYAGSPQLRPPSGIGYYVVWYASGATATGVRLRSTLCDGKASYRSFN